jgi:hypothetical protein
MDSFLDRFEEHPLEAIAYADDGALIIVAPNLETARTAMQNALDIAQTWATKMGLEFAIAKTKAMVFSRRRSPATLSQPLLIRSGSSEGL